MSNCKNYRGYIKSRKKTGPDGQPKQYDFEAIKKLLEPWSVSRKKPYAEPKIKLKVIDMETGAERYAEPAEVKTWKWGDPNTMRVVNGGHVTSWEKLQEIMRYQEEKGSRELIIYEAPRFMLLGGG